MYKSILLKSIRYELYSSHATELIRRLFFYRQIYIMLTRLTNLLAGCLIPDSHEDYRVQKYLALAYKYIIDVLFFVSFRITE